MEIDTINSVIINELLKNSRTNYSEIADKMKVTSTAIRNRYLYLKKNGVIIGSTILINPKALGYDCYGFLGVKAHRKKLEEVKKFLGAQAGIIYTWEKTQAINLGNYFALHNLEEFTELTEKIRENQFIKDTQPLIYLGSPYVQHPTKLLIKTKTEYKEKIIKNKIKTELMEILQTKENESKKYEIMLENTDREILRIFSKNSRASFNGTARNLGISTVQVINRYERLVKEKVIINSSVMINPSKIGYRANAMFYIDLEIGTNTKKLYDKILELPNVVILVEVLGDCNMLAVIALKEFQELFEIESKIRKIKGIKQVKININPPFSAWPINFFASII